VLVDVDEAAVEHLANALRPEVAHRGVDVGLRTCPGSTRRWCASKRTP
jgi:short-subunit dehydrogenase